jgi:hypothetical protein
MTATVNASYHVGYGAELARHQVHEATVDGGGLVEVVGVVASKLDGGSARAVRNAAQSRSPHIRTLKKILQASSQDSAQINKQAHRHSSAH